MRLFGRLFGRSKATKPGPIEEARARWSAHADRLAAGQQPTPPAKPTTQSYSKTPGRQARQLVSEFISFQREVPESPDEYDRLKEEQLGRIAALGAGAIPELEHAIMAIVDGSAYEFGDERAAGMLSETIGRIGGQGAFAALERILSVRTNIHEYHRDIKPGAITGLAYLAGSDARAKRIVSEFALEEGCGLKVNPILERVGVKPIISYDVIADEFLKAYSEKRQSLLDYVRSLASQNEKTKAAALFKASRRLGQMGEKQAALRGYLALLHVNPLWVPAVDDVRNLLDLKKDHPLRAPMEELRQAAFAFSQGRPRTARHKEIVQMIKDHVLQTDPDAQEVYDAVY
jgi:hypothetical protein